MELTMSLALPRDEMSIPVVRRTLQRSMEVLGVDAESCDDILLAVSEACTNVLDHARDGDDYRVSCGIDEGMCVIQVIDEGHGFDAELLGRTDAETDAEAGRGIQLMRALVDNIRFENHPREGTIVHLEKQLHWHDDAPIRRLMINGR